jgi:hypothetical protein
MCTDIDYEGQGWRRECIPARSVTSFARFSQQETLGEYAIGRFANFISRRRFTRRFTSSLSELDPDGKSKRLNSSRGASSGGTVVNYRLRAAVTQKRAAASTPSGELTPDESAFLCTTGAKGGRN